VPGGSGGSYGEKARFLNIAEGSLEECRYYLILTHDLGYGQTDSPTSTLEEVSRLLNAYARAILASGSDFWLLYPAGISRAKPLPSYRLRPSPHIGNAPALNFLPGLLTVCSSLAYLGCCGGIRTNSGPDQSGTVVRHLVSISASDHRSFRFRTAENFIAAIYHCCARLPIPVER
jgi:hypothetical protein